MNGEAADNRAMRIPIPLAALAPVAFALTACGGAPAGKAPAPVAEGPSAFQNQVAALPESERNIVFIRAIRDANHDCQGVTGSLRQGEAADGSPLYIARCDDGASYAVVIGRDGTAEVVSAPKS